MLKLNDFAKLLEELEEDPSTTKQIFDNVNIMYNEIWGDLVLTYTLENDKQTNVIECTTLEETFANVCELVKMVKLEYIKNILESRYKATFIIKKIVTNLGKMRVEPSILYLTDDGESVQALLPLELTQIDNAKTLERLNEIANDVTLYNI